MSRLTLEDLASKIPSFCKSDERLVICIAGPPGSGKSTSADLLQELLEQKFDLSTEVVPMDGYHYDNSILKERGLLSRKGAPETFDVDGFSSTVKRLVECYQLKDVAIPVFDRALELSRGSARLIKRETKVLLIEGNYLLLDSDRWSGLREHYNVTVMIECDEAELRKRLIQRWLDHNYSEQLAIEKAESNDLPNARKVMDQSIQADYVLIQKTDSK